MANDKHSNFKLAIYLVGGGGYALFSGLKRMRQRRKVEDTACSEIKSAPQGLVEFEGYALPLKTGYLNRLGKPVAFREFKIQEYVGRGRNSTWETIFSETEGATLVVSDGTGLVLVETTGGDLILDETLIEWSKIPTEEKAPLYGRYHSKVPGLAPSEVGFFSLKTSKNFRIKEREIKIGAPVYVRGSFSTTQGLAPYVISPLHFRFLEKIALFRKDRTSRLKAFDFDRNGTIDEFELSKGSEKLLYQSKNSIQADDVPESVALQGIMRHESTHGLTIGDSHQAHLLKKLSAWNLIRVVGGSILIAAGVALLFT